MDGAPGQSFPTSSGILFGGVGGFFDGIVLHQVLQWHHMLTDAGYPPTSVDNLEINTLWDGLFHATTYVFVVLGLIVLWRTSRRTHIRWSSKLLVGPLLMGFGLFNLVEGIVDQGIHHANETVPQEQWIYWDLGYTAPPTPAPRTFPGGAATRAAQASLTAQSPIAWFQAHA